MDSILKRPHWQLALLSGVLIGLSYPPLHLGFLAWFGLIPLIHVILNVKSGQAARLAFLASITANFISLYWIGFNSGAGFLPVFASLVGAVLYLGIFWAGLGYFVSSIEKRSSQGLIALPFVWVTMEFLRSLGALGFPWINLALTQTVYLPLIQIADITGSYGISFWIILINIGFYLAIISKDKRKYLIFTSLVFLLVFSFGIIRINTIDDIKTHPVTIAITQPNINPDEKWDPESREQNFALMHDLLDSALNLNPDLVLWPESAVPTYLRLSSLRRRPITTKLAKFNVPLLSGTVDRIINSDGEKIYYNSTIFIKPDDSIKMYNKIHLVPFAEYIPLSEKFPTLKKLNFGQGNFTSGKEYTVFELDSVKFSNLICYESSMPKAVRNFIKNGAQFITIQANDGWLGNSAGPYQHFELARLRAVENRVPIVRCANTGISGVINPIGIVQQKIPLGNEAIIIADILPIQNLTFYTKYGEIFAVLCIIISLIIFTSAWINRTK
ncbi:apolipoprotein N-acyltransferase [bacterium]|nr:apolipoprotein N-acyltransferase [bacterium]